MPLAGCGVALMPVACATASFMVASPRSSSCRRLMPSALAGVCMGVRFRLEPPVTGTVSRGLCSPLTTTGGRVEEAAQEGSGMLASQAASGRMVRSGAGEREAHGGREKRRERQAPEGMDGSPEWLCRCRAGGPLDQFRLLPRAVFCGPAALSCTPKGRTNGSMTRAVQRIFCGAFMQVDNIHPNLSD